MQNRKITQLLVCYRVCPCFGGARGRRGVGWRRRWQGWSRDSTSVKTISVNNATIWRQDNALLLW